MLERVLIPLDGTADAESVVPLLEPILKRTGSEVFLVQALPSAGADPEHGPMEQADRYLKSVADRFQAGACVHTLVGVGSAPQVIESLAAGEEVTLIAMPSHGDAAGPVLDRLLRGSARTVLALNPVPTDRVSRKTAGKTILAPLDGSLASRRSLPLALELAGALDARVILMRVLETEAEETEALHELHEVAHRLAQQGLSAEIWIESGNPTEKILQVCRDEGVQMVVLTTLGRSESTDHVFGKVTRELLKRAPVPVLAVHARG
jgi:nucleotide-binding universal stress UspA family protein